MTIKQHGGVFGRNPSFNDVEVKSLSIDGNAALDAGDIGSSVQAYDADTAKLDVAQTFTGTQTFEGGVISQGQSDDISGSFKNAQTIVIGPSATTTICALPNRSIALFYVRDTSNSATFHTGWAAIGFNSGTIFDIDDNSAFYTVALSGRNLQVTNSAAGDKTFSYSILLLAS